MRLSLSFVGSRVAHQISTYRTINRSSFDHTIRRMSTAMRQTAGIGHPLPSRTSVFHVLLVRHAESFNNVLAEQFQREYGQSPYQADANIELVQKYDAMRKIDPDLSLLGKKQAHMLIEHPHLFDVRWFDLALAGRLNVLTSPMLRTVQTSLPLLIEMDRLHKKVNQMHDITLQSPSDKAQEQRRKSNSVQHLIQSTSLALSLDEQAITETLTSASLPAPLSRRALLHPDFFERG